MSKGTKFIKLKRCIDCWEVNSWESTSCIQCGKLFVREATEEEKMKSNDELIKQQEKAKKNKFVVEF